MESLLARLPSRARIAVIRLRSLGDCVLTTPALGLLKGYRPDLRIRMVVEPRFAGVFEGHPDIEEIGPDVGRRMDMVLNLHGGSRSMWMTLASGAKFGVGFGHHRHSWIYSHKIPRAQEILGEDRPVHTAEHLASAMFWLGVPRREIPRARLIAGLARIVRDVGLAEELAQDALVAALETWPESGVPDNPGAWLQTDFQS